MVQIRSSPPTSLVVAAISGEQCEIAAFVARFERPIRTREGRISASFDAVRVFLSARVQVGSVSQLLRLNATGTLAADVADMEMSRRPYMVGAIGLFETDHSLLSRPV
jgi:hypothetical protein